MKMDDAIRDFELDCKYRKLSPKTTDNYRKQLKIIQRYLEKEFSVSMVEEVRQVHLKSFLAKMTDDEKKPNYINDLLKVAKVFFAYSAREGYISKNIAKDVKKAKQPKLKLLTFNDAEIRRLIEHYDGKDYLSIRNKTILAMFFDTGIRLNELITLHREQVFEDKILIHGKGNKERFVPISPFLSKMLLRYETARTAFFEDKLPERYFFLCNDLEAFIQENPDTRLIIIDTLQKIREDFFKKKQESLCGRELLKTKGR